MLKGEARRKMNLTYVLGFVVLRDVVKVFPVSSSPFAKKTTQESSTKSLGGSTRPDDKVAFQNDHSCHSRPGLDRAPRSIASQVLRVGQLLHLRKGQSFPVWQSFMDPSEIR